MTSKLSQHFLSEYVYNFCSRFNGYAYLRVEKCNSTIFGGRVRNTFKNNYKIDRIGIRKFGNL